MKVNNSNQTTQLNLDELCREQKSDQFCKNKAKSISTDKPLEFVLDNNGILRKIVKLKYTIEPTLVIPKNSNTELFLTSNKGKGHQGIMRTVHMISRYFWCIGLCLDIQHYISMCKLCAQFLPSRVLTKPMHLDIPNVPFTGCAVECISLLLTTSKGHKFALNLFVYSHLM